MDANGLRFWSLMNPADWAPVKGQEAGFYYDTAKRRLRLPSESAATSFPEDSTAAQGLLKQAPMARDAYGGRAWWDASAGQVKATGAMPDDVPLYTPPAGQVLTDVCLGFDGILYMAVGGTLVLMDRRGRWDAQPLAGAAFSFYRLAAHPQGGVWALNAAGTVVARIQGEPLANRPAEPMAPNAFDYVDANHNPPRITAQYNVPAGEQAVAVAADPVGTPAILLWVASQPARVRRLGAMGQWSEAQLLGSLQFPYSFVFLDANTIAVLITGWNQALAFDLSQAVPVPSGTPYPLPGFQPGPFLHGVAQPPEFPTAKGSAGLYPLSYASFARGTWVQGAQSFDSGSAGTTWHRLYLEAAIPAGCAVRVLLAASDRPIITGDPANTGLPWWEHRFASSFRWEEPANTAPEIPAAAWVPEASEIPFHPGLLGCREAGTKGLFTALVQRGGCSTELPDKQAGDASLVHGGTAVRALRGRYLAVRVQLLGNGRATPEIAALRAYGSRFSYIANYLPELYREQKFSPEGDALGSSTGADFLERFLDNFEGILTPLEDRVAASYLVTRAETARADSLPWLASWIGLSFDPAWPRDRRRDLLRAAPRLYRLHGTLAGLELALDTATGGLQSQGSIVVLEDYRMRHTFATILGADLEDAQNPLLPGLAHSGNSFVGNTLFLGDEARKDFLALFSASAVQTAGEAAAAADFYARFAHRVTVLVHEDAAEQWGLVQRVVEIEKPAHVMARVLQASTALLVGLASILGLDTFLRDRPAPQPVRVDVSAIGGVDLVEQLPSLDPRLEGGLPPVPWQNPIAELAPPGSVTAGQPIALDAGGSKAGDGRTISEYRWQIVIGAGAAPVAGGGGAPSPTAETVTFTGSPASGSSAAPRVKAVFDPPLAAGQSVSIQLIVVDDVGDESPPVTVVVTVQAPPAKT